MEFVIEFISKFTEMAAMIPDSQVKITTSSYGKTGVKLLYVRRQGDWHDITEYEGA